MNNSGPCGSAASWPIGQHVDNAVPHADNAAHPGAASQAGTGATTSPLRGNGWPYKRTYNGGHRGLNLLVSGGLYRIELAKRTENKIKNQASFPFNKLSHRIPCEAFQPKSQSYSGTLKLNLGSCRLRLRLPSPPPGHSSSKAKQARGQARDARPSRKWVQQSETSARTSPRAQNPSHPRPPPAFTAP